MGASSVIERHWKIGGQVKAMICAHTKPNRRMTGLQPVSKDHFGQTTKLEKELAKKDAFQRVGPVAQTRSCRAVGELPSRNGH